MLCFSTPTTLDLRLLTTMGVNIKPNSASPIGYFGTGLKYAIAVLLRTGHKLKLETGGKTYHFETAVEEIRGKTFELCHMVGPEGATSLPFTTEYGKNWLPWMAYRELASNTWDEGGSIFTHEPICQADETQFTVIGEEIDKVHQNRDQYFLSPNLKSFHKDSSIEIYNAPSDCIFYKGIRAYELSEPSKLTYNIVSPQRLTEDRTFQGLWSISSICAKALDQSSNSFLVTTAITAPTENFEAHLEYRVRMASDTFREAALHHYKTAQIANAYLLRAVRNYLATEVHTKHREPTVREAQLIQRAITFLSHTSIPITYPIKIAPALPNNILGGAVVSPPTIILSAKAFEQGLRSLCATLIEEQLHLQTGALDETRAMQEAFLNVLLLEMEARQEVYL